MNVRTLDPLDENTLIMYPCTVYVHLTVPAHYKIAYWIHIVNCKLYNDVFGNFLAFISIQNIWPRSDQVGGKSILHVF